ncbi:Spy/CpxP family protein refolding chaperone [Halobacteriovorax sp. GB3]|uniref:Spy/CpxP family protein refolding chaperone n=1 Tax=Halobacteriovorax sp. GB3 TaxID=2719615 RepID=UPI0023603EDE|nr:Spy/CpxP family protein refolding chaperone [Halobacteriovorax sp. GB3]MDD0851509.1 Spy/CpxP family protein refolding chaperone [Halobacteriovorax sp. GB3]
MKLLKITSIVGLLFLISCRAPEDRIEKISAKVVEKLELTKEQKVKFEDLKKTLISLEKEKRSKGRKHRFDDVKNELKSDHFDVNTIVKGMEENFSKKLEFTKTIGVKIQVFHASLTPEQREKLSAFIEKMEERRKEKWKKHRRAKHE